MFTAAILLNIVFFVSISWASFGHFENKGRIPIGAHVIALLTIVGTGLNLWWTLTGEAPTAFLVVIAIVLTLSALAVFAAAIVATRPAGLSLAFSDRTPKTVVDHGIYGVVRHPFYAAYLLYWTSWVALSGASVVSIMFLGAMLVAYILAAAKEERLLASRLGEDYRKLQIKTWRFVPGLY